MHGVLIIEDVCCKKNYWCPVKSIYPSSIFFLHSGPGVVPRWSRKFLLWRTRCYRTVGDLQDVRCTHYRTGKALQDARKRATGDRGDEVYKAMRL